MTKIIKKVYTLILNIYNTKNFQNLDVYFIDKDELNEVEKKYNLFLLQQERKMYLVDKKERYLNTFKPFAEVEFTEDILKENKKNKFLKSLKTNLDNNIYY